ncbi:YgaP family membrane protein [Ancylomarina sp. YFZ004]
MKKNMGPIDRILRSIVAIALIVLFIMDIITGTIGIVVVVFASIMLISAIIGNCPPYALMGFNTCKKKD